MQPFSVAFIDDEIVTRKSEMTLCGDGRLNGEAHRRRDLYRIVLANASTLDQIKALPTRIDASGGVIIAS